MYVAWHKRLCKHVVIKEILCSPSISTALHRNEAEALKNIKCTSLPQVFDFYMDRDRSFTVLEYIEGESLDALLKQKKKFSRSELLRWFYRLADSLEVIHNNNVCHRDIKPANIVLRPTGDVCLIDFNSALVRGNNTGVISRSLAYASPEQYAYFRLCDNIDGGNTSAAVRNTIDFSTDSACITVQVAEKEVMYRPITYNINWNLSDIYSLGATMYHLLTGIRPPELLLEDIVFPTTSTSNPEVSGIPDAIRKCMKINPSERFNSACELRIALYKLFTP